MGAEVAELGQTAHKFEVESGVFVQIVGKEAGIECTEDLVNGGRQVDFGCGFPRLKLRLFFEPSLVGAQTPAGNVMACDAGVAAFGEGGGDFGVRAVVEEEVVDEIADCGGETGDFAGGTTGEVLRPSFAGPTVGRGWRRRIWRGGRMDFDCHD